MQFVKLICSEVATLYIIINKCLLPMVKRITVGCMILNFELLPCTVNEFWNAMDSSATFLRGSNSVLQNAKKCIQQCIQAIKFDSKKINRPFYSNAWLGTLSWRPGFLLVTSYYLHLCVCNVITDIISNIHDF